MKKYKKHNILIKLMMISYSLFQNRSLPFLGRTGLVGLLQTTDEKLIHFDFTFSQNCCRVDNFVGYSHCRTN